MRSEIRELIEEAEKWASGQRTYRDGADIDLVERLASALHEVRRVEDWLNAPGPERIVGGEQGEAVAAIEYDDAGLGFGQPVWEIAADDFVGLGRALAAKGKSS